jgi:hypothetical protein
VILGEFENPLAVLRVEIPHPDVALVPVRPDHGGIVDAQSAHRVFRTQESGKQLCSATGKTKLTRMAM